MAARLAPGMIRSALTSKQSALTSFNSLPAPQSVTVPVRLSSGSPLPNVWVEDGVIWNVATNVALGFTSYGAQTSFMSLAKTSFPGYGLQAPPKSWYAGAFSASDMPILVQQSSALLNNTLLLWPSLASLPFASNFLSQLPVTLLEKPALGSAAMAPSTAQSFQAMSPKGQQTFSAQYLLFSPWGASPNPFYTSVSAIGAVFYDLVEFGWGYK